MWERVYDFKNLWVIAISQVAKTGFRSQSLRGNWGVDVFIFLILQLVEGVYRKSVFEKPNFSDFWCKEYDCSAWDSIIPR